MDETFVSIVRQAFERDILVAAICHAPQLLIEAGVVKGRNMTCYASVKTHLKDAGAQYENREVVVDANLITSPQLADLPAFHARDDSRACGAPGSPQSILRSPVEPVLQQHMGKQ